MRGSTYASRRSRCVRRRCGRGRRARLRVPRGAQRVCAATGHGAGAPGRPPAAAGGPRQRPAPDARTAPQGRVGGRPGRPAARPRRQHRRQHLAPGRHPGRAGGVLGLRGRARRVRHGVERLLRASAEEPVPLPAAAPTAGAVAVAAAADRGPRQGDARPRLDRPDQHARDARARRVAGRVRRGRRPASRSTTATAWSRGRSHRRRSYAWASPTRPTSASSTP